MTEYNFKDIDILQRIERERNGESRYLLWIEKKHRYCVVNGENTKIEKIFNNKTNEDELIYYMECEEYFLNITEAIKFLYIYEIDDRYNLSSGLATLRSIREKKRVNKKDIAYLKDLERFLCRIFS